jgi:hypothetical protein
MWGNAPTSSSAGSHREQCAAGVGPGASDGVVERHATAHSEEGGVPGLDARRQAQGEADEVILDIDDLRARPLLAKKVKVSGTSQDFAPVDGHAYVMRLEVTSLAASK